MRGGASGGASGDASGVYTCREVANQGRLHGGLVHDARYCAVGWCC